MKTQTLEQQRAQFCLDAIKKISDEKKFKSNAMRLPQMLVLNGLIPTLAFYKSKNETIKVYNAVNDWLKERKLVVNDALSDLSKADFQKLRLATLETLALAEWLKRIAEIHIKD